MDTLVATRHQLYDVNTTVVRDETYYSDYATAADDEEYVSEIYHEATKMKNQTGAKLGRSVDHFSSGPMAKATALMDVDFPKAETVTLPEPSLDDVSLETALQTRRSVRDYHSEESVTLEEVSTLLGLGVGETGSLRTAVGLDKPVRSYPSPGGLYPVEVYPLVFDVDGLDPGIYYYNPARHVLRLVEPAGEEFVEDVVERVSLPDIVDWETVSVVFSLVGSLWRVRTKYGPRGYRFALQETGHIAQNLLLTAAAMGLGSVPIGGFEDDPVSELFDADGVNEAALYLIPVGNTPNDDD